MPASTWSTTDKTASLTLTGSNLIATAGAAAQGARGKDPKSTGKYYIEYTSTTTQGSNSGVGFAAARCALGSNTWAQAVGNAASSGSLFGYDNFSVSQLNFAAGVGMTTGTVVCYAIDLDRGLIWIRSGAAGNWNNNAANNPATGVGGQSLQAIGLGQGIDCYPFVYLQTSGNSITANLGGSAFTGAVPAGFTSGWDDSVSIVTNTVATQVAVEEWGVGPSDMQTTQVAVEEWGSTDAPIWVTQAALEHWYTTGNPPLWVTQAAIEQWGSVQATYPVPANPTFVLSGSRAGIGSVVVRL